MNVEQVYTLVNAATGEVLGESAVLNRDLTNVVDIGTNIFNANAVDAYVKSLVNHIGKVIFVNRKYSGSVPSVLMDGWEYGSIVEKVRAELPDAQANASWALTNNTSYDPNVFIEPEVHAKFFNSKVTFELQLSIAEKQVKQILRTAGTNVIDETYYVKCGIFGKKITLEERQAIVDWARKMQEIVAKQG